MGRIQSGQKLLLIGAGGGVGTFALQMAKLYEAEVTAVDKAGKLEMSRAMGADHVIDYLKEDFTRSGKRYDLILDVKTNRSPFAYARALRPNGTYVTVGGDIPRLLQVLVLGPLASRMYGKKVRIVTDVRVVCFFLSCYYLGRGKGHDPAMTSFFGSPGTYNGLGGEVLTWLLANCTHRVRDPVYGFIRFSDDERKILDLAEVQRLRRIKQLALTSYVYPGAMHTRFEHSLGVLELVTRMFMGIRTGTDAKIWQGMVVSRLRDVELSEQQALQVLRLAALLHDLGHLPFSHGGEMLLPEGIKHEHVSIAIAESIEAQLDQFLFKGATRRAIQIIHPEGENCPTEILFLRGLLSGEIDADRCDYLVRDSLHCGVSYGRFDLERLLDSLLVVDNGGTPEIVVDAGGLHAVEALVLARYYMYLQVYHHRTRRLFDHYLAVFCGDTLPGFNQTSLLDIVKLDDYRVLSMIRDSVLGGESTKAGRYARQLWFRGGEDGKHSAVFETNEFAGIRWVANISKRVGKLAASYPDCDVFVDNRAKGRIHSFYSKDDQEEEGELTR